MRPSSEPYLEHLEGEHPGGSFSLEEEPINGFHGQSWWAMTSPRGPRVSFQMEHIWGDP